MGLTTEERILIEQHVTNSAKSPAAAYLLWFFDIKKVYRRSIHNRYLTIILNLPKSIILPWKITCRARIA